MCVKTAPYTYIVKDISQFIGRINADIVTLGFNYTVLKPCFAALLAWYLRQSKEKNRIQGTKEKYLLGHL